MKMYMEEAIDHVVDTLREARVILTNNDLLDEHMEDAIYEALEVLGVEDPGEN